MNLTPAEQKLLVMLHETLRLANFMAREFSRDYRDAVDTLKYRQRRNGWSDEMYRQRKNDSWSVKDALSRWHWWTDEAGRVAGEIQSELGLLAAIEDPAARPLPDLESVREQLEAHEAAAAGRQTAPAAA